MSDYDLPTTIIKEMARAIWEKGWGNNPETHTGKRPSWVDTAARATAQVILEQGYIERAIEISPISGHVPVRNPGWYLVIPVSDGGSET